MGVALADLLPLLRQSIDWFEGLVREHEAMSEVMSSELETGLLSSGDPVEGDTTVSTSREVRAFYALEEVCGLDADTLGRFKIDSNSRSELGFVCPVRRIGPVISSPGRYAFMSLPSSVG